MNASVVIAWQDRAAMAETLSLLASSAAGAEIIAEEWRQREGIAQARWRGLRRALGDIVISLGERYSPPASDWLGQVCEAHRRRPDADVIAGAIALAPGVGLAARAQYLWEYAHVTPERLQSALPSHIPGGHVSYLRAALSEADFAGAWSELDYHAAMARRGLRFACEPALVVNYRPEAGYLGDRFRWSFEEGVLRASRLPRWQRPLAAAARVALPPLLLGRALTRSGWSGAPMIPMWSAFALVQAAGEVAGRLRG